MFGVDQLQTRAIDVAGQTFKDETAAYEFKAVYKNNFLRVYPADSAEIEVAHVIRYPDGYLLVIESPRCEGAVYRIACEEFHNFSKVFRFPSVPVDTFGRSTQTEPVLLAESVPTILKGKDALVIPATVGCKQGDLIQLCKEMYVVLSAYSKKGLTLLQVELQCSAEAS